MVLHRKQRVICLDAHELMLVGIEAALSPVPELTYIAGVRSIEDLRPAVRTEKPDIVILEPRLPEGCGITAIRDCSSWHAGARVIVHTLRVRDRLLDASFEAGARAYVCKADPAEELIEAIRRVSAGETYVSSLARRRVRNGPDDQTPASRINDVTPREMEVLRLIAMGFSRTQIAEQIHRSPKTVDAHRASLMKKLGLNDCVGLTRFAIREGLVEV